MNNLANTHLTESDLDDLLIGDASSAATGHLAACAECRVRLDAAQQPLATFRDASIAWSERRSATMPLVTPAPRVKAFALPRRFAALATALVVMAGVGLPWIEHRTHNQSAGENITVAANALPAHPGSARSVTSDAPSDNELNRDNAMLGAIHREYDSSADRSLLN